METVYIVVIWSSLNLRRKVILEKPLFFQWDNLNQTKGIAYRAIAYLSIDFLPDDLTLEVALDTLVSFFFDIKVTFGC